MSSQHREELVVLVPQKVLARAKTRLRSVLSKEARTSLSLQMLRHVLHVCSQLKDASALLLVGPLDLAPLAAEYGAEIVEGGEQGMRRDVARATMDWHIWKRAALLFVSSDLPLLTLEDLQAMVEAWREGADVVLAPDLRERATNAMLLDRPDDFPYAFGEVLGSGSFHTHRDQALGHNMRVAEVRRIGLQLDLDLPADLAHFVAHAPDNALAQYCAARMHDEFRFE